MPDASGVLTASLTHSLPSDDRSMRGHDATDAATIRARLRDWHPGRGSGDPAARPPWPRAVAASLRHQRRSAGHCVERRRRLDAPGPACRRGARRPGAASLLDSTSRLTSRASRPARPPCRPEDEPGDYKVLADFAAAGSRARPILVGVSEGAGLSVLAATDPATRTAIGGVIGLGLPDINELGWRWKDSLIYITHGTPNEPTFSTASVIGRMSPSPLAVIHSTHDEFVPARRSPARAERCTGTTEAVDRQALPITASVTTSPSSISAWRKPWPGCRTRPGASLTARLMSPRHGHSGFQLLEPGSKITFTHAGVPDGDGASSTR